MISLLHFHFQQRYRVLFQLNVTDVSRHLHGLYTDTIRVLQRIGGIDVIGINLPALRPLQGNISSQHVKIQQAVLLRMLVDQRQGEYLLCAVAGCRPPISRDFQ